MIFYSSAFPNVTDKEENQNLILKSRRKQERTGRNYFTDHCCDMAQKKLGNTDVNTDFSIVKFASVKNY